MKDSKFPDAQRTFILKQGADGFLESKICRRDWDFGHMTLNPTTFHLRYRFSRRASTYFTLDEKTQSFDASALNQSMAGHRPLT